MGSRRSPASPSSATSSPTINDFTVEAEGATMWLGVQAPLVIGGGGVALAFVLAMLWRLRGRSGDFFDRRPSSAPPHERPPRVQGVGVRYA
jgi:TRAP-type C4-dicarboxylate transport system permease small subunit